MGESAVGQIRSKLFSAWHSESVEFLADTVRHRDGAGSFCLTELAEFLVGYIANPPHGWNPDQLAGMAFDDLAAVVKADRWKPASGPPFVVFRLIRSLRDLAFFIRERASLDHVVVDEIESAFSLLADARGSLAESAAVVILQQLCSTSGLPYLTDRRKQDVRRELFRRQSQALVNVADDVNAEYVADNATAERTTKRGGRRKSEAVKKRRDEEKELADRGLKPGEIADELRSRYPKITPNLVSKDLGL